MTPNDGALLTIDPGVHACGCAIFARGRLVKAAYVKTNDPNTLAQAVVDFQTGYFATHVAIERQRIYDGGRKQKIDLNDLLDLSRVVGRLEERYRSWPAQLIYPQDWKGQVPKEIMTKRIQRALTPDEMAVIVSAGSKDHNTFDAIGIGLFVLGRCKVGCPK